MSMLAIVIVTGHLWYRESAPECTGWRSCSAYNSCGLMPTGSRINICTYFVSETQTFPHGRVWGRSERSNGISDANLLTVIHSNYGSILRSSILRSFQDMTTRWTTDDGPTVATIAYLALCGQQSVMFNTIIQKNIMWPPKYSNYVHICLFLS